MVEMTEENNVPQFIKGNNYLNNEHFHILKRDLDTEGAIYSYAKEHGFSTFDQFADAIVRGFNTFEMFKDAAGKGFNHVVSYQKAMEGGFEDADEYRAARKAKIYKKVEFLQYRELDEIRNEASLDSIPKAHVFKILSEIEFGKKISLSVLHKVLVEEYQVHIAIYESHGRWYREGPCSMEEIEEILKESPFVSRFGYYDPVGQVFEKEEVLPISDKHIVIDGSNVAWASGSRDHGDKPSVKNIMKVVVELNKKGFQDIVVFVDAALRYQVEDKEKFEELEAMDFIEVTPAERDGDDFIIKYAREKNAYIITNDTMRDWREKDDWVRAHIDDHRVAFQIVNDVVIFDENLKQ